MQEPHTNKSSAPLTDAVASTATPVVERESVAQGLGKKMPLILAAGLVICFAWPLYDLFRFSLHSELYSHICAVPFISGYLLWMHRKEWAAECKSARLAVMTFAFLGLALLSGYWIARSQGWQPEAQNRLCLLTLAFVSLFLGCGALFLGRHNLRLNAFPLGFLVFLAPLPLTLEHGIETLLQYASADTSYWMMKIAGTTIHREGTVFMLPGFSINVAPECSGIHSTLILFITGLIAGHYFLRRTSTKVALTIAVILLGVLRNAARIFTLLQLALHIDPKILDSPLHHSGGPWFFLGSLVPFFLLILLFRKIERRAEK